MNEDDVGCFTRRTGDSVPLGRWFHGLLRPLEQNITSPVVLTVSAILALAFASAAITWTLEVRSRRVALLTSLVVVTTPAVAFSAGYFPGFDSFQGSIMFGALAVLATVRFKWGFPLGAIFIMLSLASYQAGVNVAVAMAVVVLARSLVLAHRSTRDLLALAGRLLGLGVLGGFFYWLSVRISLNVTGLDLSEYRGMNRAFDAFGPRELLHRARQAVKPFFDFFFGQYYAIPRLLTIAAILLGVLAFGLFVARAVRMRLSPLRVIASLALLALVPLALNFSGIFQADQSSFISVQAFTLAFVIALVFIEQGATAVALPFARGAAAFLVLAICAQNFIVTENYYVKLEAFSHRTMSLSTRIVARVEPLLGSSSTVAILGGVPNLLEPPAWEDFSQMKLRDQGLWGQYIGVTPGKNAVQTTSKASATAACRQGVQFTSPTEEQLEDAMEAALDMPVWPSEGSVALKGDVIVVNLGVGKIVETGSMGKEHTFEAFFSRGFTEGRDVLYTFSVWKDGKKVGDYHTDDSPELTIKLKKHSTYDLRAFMSYADAPSPQPALSDTLTITVD